MLTKDVDVSLKAGPDDGLEEGQFTAYASVFGNKDSYGDVVVKGAFADSLKAWEKSSNVLPLLFGHNFSDPDYNLGSVIDAKEDDHGLKVTAQLDLESPKAAQVYRLLKGRRISQMSFAYDIEEAESVTKNEEHVYELRKLKIHEVSVVPLGANQETEILAVKSNAEALASSKAQFNDEQLAALASAHEVLSQILEANPPEDNATADEASADDEAAKADEGTDGVKSAAVSPDASAKHRATQLQFLEIGN